MQTAISRKKASDKSGDMPTMVVPAASMTGLSRLTLAATIALGSKPFSATRLSISSTRTTQFLISIPDKDKNPRKDGNVNDRSVTKRLMTTPQTVIGTVNQMMMGCLSLPNSRIVTKNINPKVSGIIFPSVSRASELPSYSPPHSNA